jgi:OOP family OmpA-OmpF porin
MNTLVKLNLVALALAAVIGCAQKQVAGGEPQRQAQAASITQIGYGSHARYVTCPLAGCARPTPKTMLERASAEDEPAPRTGAAVPLSSSMLTPTTLMAAAAPMMAFAATPAPVASAPSVTPAPAAASQADAAKPIEKVQIEKDAPKPAAALSSSADSTPDKPQRVYIGFPPGSARLTAEARKQLDRLVPHVQEAHKVVIKGRTDERGDNDTNDRLALRRAMAVYDHLKRAAKAGDKPFKLLAKGACCYIARNDTEAGRAANRRAEIDFVVPLQASESTTRRAPSKAHSS